MKVALACTQFGYLVSVGAFHVLPNSHHDVAMGMIRDAGEEGLSRRTFAGACAAFAAGSLIFGCPQYASAVDSSLTLSEAIKTLDFSLPSYDAIANSKASVETVDGLAEKYAQPETPRGMPRKPKPEPKESSGGNPLSAVLPSMNKGNVKKPKAPKPSSREATEKEDMGSVGVETMDLTLPSYSFSSGKEKNIFAL